LIFTAHSIPSRLAEQSNYQLQLLESARAVAARVGCSDWTLVFQSRSGRPEDPWLGPDIADYLRASRAEGLRAAVLCPIGFLCDHIEVLYDLDYAAANVAREAGIAMTRAAAVNDNPLFLDMMRDVVMTAIRRYSSGKPVRIGS
jgi:protoporphyrin/coproporphyrin ferrochelatase